jgi:hypothetical protein
MPTTPEPRHACGIANVRPEDQQCDPQDAEHRQVQEDRAESPANSSESQNGKTPTKEQDRPAKPTW